MNKEKVVWSGSPSQLTNVKTYVISAILTPLVIGPFIALWAYLNTKGTTYTLTNSRLRYGSGVLNKTQHSMELYRVKDIALSEPLLFRLFGLANLNFATSDQSHPHLSLKAIPSKIARKLSDQLPSHIEKIHQTKGVREFDVA